MASTFSVPASATDWVLVDESDEANYFVDRSSIRQSGAYKRAWTKMEALNRSTPYQAFIILHEYDCRNLRARKVQYSVFHWGGGLAARFPGEMEWDYVIPDTLVGSGLQYVCFGRFP